MKKRRCANTAFGKGLLVVNKGDDKHTINVSVSARMLSLRKSDWETEVRVESHVFQLYFMSEA